MNERAELDSAHLMAPEHAVSVHYQKKEEFNKANFSPGELNMF